MRIHSLKEFIWGNAESWEAATWVRVSLSEGITFQLRPYDRDLRPYLDQGKGTASSVIYSFWSHDTLFSYSSSNLPLLCIIILSKHIFPFLYMVQGNIFFTLCFFSVSRSWAASCDPVRNKSYHLEHENNHPDSLSDFCSNSVIYLFILKTTWEALIPTFWKTIWWQL